MNPSPWAAEVNVESSRTSTRPAIVLGAAYSGLAFARSLGRRGIPVFILDSRPAEPGMHSRHARPSVLPDPLSDPEAWIGSLLAAGPRLDCCPVIFPAGDPHLALLSSARDALRQFYDFSIPDSAVLRLLSDKRAQYEYLRSKGVDLPRTRLPESAAQAESDARELGFPCLAKPALSYLWTAASATKLAVVTTPGEAASSYRAMTAAGGGFLLQELIPGADDRFHGALCYFDTQGRPLVTFTKRKVRQYPERFGNGSVQISADLPELAQLSQEIFRGLRYAGFGSIEFKSDPADNRMKLIEINPRSVSGLQLAIDSGCDMPWLAYADITGVPAGPPSVHKPGVLFVNEAWELRRAWQSRSPVEWLRCAANLPRARSFAAFSLDDPGPIWSHVRRALRSVRPA